MPLVIYVMYIVTVARFTFIKMSWKSWFQSFYFADCIQLIVYRIWNLNSNEKPSEKIKTQIILFLLNVRHRGYFYDSSSMCWSCRFTPITIWDQSFSLRQSIQQLLPDFKSKSHCLALLYLISKPSDNFKLQSIL